MKKIFVTVCAAAIALGFASCKKEEQSKLDLGAFSGKAVVKGQVSYNSGYFKDASDGNKEYYDYYKPAANQTLIIELLNEGGEVIKSETITTDGNGMYSVELPATENVALEAYIQVQFEATKTLAPVGDEAPKTQQCQFTGTAFEDLYPNQTGIGNIKIATSIVITPDLN
ncbi:MAG: hypothetical protein LBR55_01385 [Bacteroidales bacterium]|jgi:hypothetical protein|nr:hypothetical protein [Bacteroidales bacterium]